MPDWSEVCLIYDPDLERHELTESRIAIAGGGTAAARNAATRGLTARSGSS